MTAQSESFFSTIGHTIAGYPLVFLLIACYYLFVIGIGVYMIILRRKLLGQKTESDKSQSASQQSSSSSTTGTDQQIVLPDQPSILNPFAGKPSRRPRPVHPLLLKLLQKKDDGGGLVEPKTLPQDVDKKSSGTSVSLHPQQQPTSTISEGVPSFIADLEQTKRGKDNSKTSLKSGPKASTGAKGKKMTSKVEPKMVKKTQSISSITGPPSLSAIRAKTKSDPASVVSKTASSKADPKSVISRGDSKASK